MSIPTLTIKRTFTPTTIYQRQNGSVTYEFKASLVGKPFAGSYSIAQFIDREIKDLIANVYLSNINYGNVGTFGLTFSYSTSVGLTLNFNLNVLIPAGQTRTFSITFLYARANVSAVLGPAFNNFSQFDIITTVPENSTYLNSNSNTLIAYTFNPPRE